MLSRALTYLLASTLIITQLTEAQTPPTAADLILMDFEELVNMDVEISSAGKQATRAMDLPYAAYVVTSEEIVSAGAQTIPDALRLIPGVAVGQISASEWSISIRGSGGRFSRFVLVMVDGRIAYNTVFSGVNWSELNYLMTAIDRIEVIRGPNASTWGANAVNGIIHIITKRSHPEAHASISSWGGETGHYGAAVQFNSALSQQWSLGINGHTESRRGLTSLNDVTEENSKNWRVSADFSSSAKNRDTRININAFGINESPYLSWVNPQLTGKTIADINEHKSGWTLLTEHSHTFSDALKLKVRGAIDEIERVSILYEWYSTNTQVDIELNSTTGMHQLSAGINARRNNSNLESKDVFSVELSPTSRVVDSLGLYLNDVVTLNQHWQATFSLRWDNHELSNADTQPSLRLLWQPSSTHSFWWAASKATATPPRAINDILNSPYDYIPAQGAEQPLPVLITIASYDHNQNPTQVRALEFGWRKTFNKFNIDIALFDQSYTGEVALLPIGQPSIILDESYTPIRVEQLNVFSNQRDFTVQGFEASTRVQITPIWTANLSYSRQRFLDNLGPWISALTLQNSISISDTLKLNVGLRHSHGDASTTAQYQDLQHIYSPIDNYAVADINLTWQLGKAWNIAGQVHNIGKKHVEAMREQFVTTANNIEPFGQVKVSYSF